jgi:hypothetical protein
MKRDAFAPPLAFADELILDNFAGAGGARSRKDPAYFFSLLPTAIFAARERACAARRTPSTTMPMVSAVRCGDVRTAAASASEHSAAVTMPLTRAANATLSLGVLFFQSLNSCLRLMFDASKLEDQYD